MPAARYISRIRLSNFRNYKNGAIDCDERHIVLCGKNGAGKTNLLEAISLFSPGRGLRRAPLQNLCHTQTQIQNTQSQVTSAQLQTYSENDWAIAISLASENGTIDMGTGSSENGKGRKARINGVNVKSIEQLSEYIRLLWITPDMDTLFRGGTSDRRRFFDRLVTTLIPDHNIALNKYEKAMRQRNKLLESDGNDRWLSAIEAQMAQYAGAIYFSRLDCLGHLQLLVDKSIDLEAFPSSILSLSALFDDGHQPNSSSALENKLLQIWRTQRAKDRSAKRTLIGVHKVDLQVVHRQKSMPAALCSTGEQKALLIGLVLAHARLVAKMTGITPILLLDEIAAHLDPERRISLFDSLEALNTQCWMSGTDPMLFAALGKRANYFEISDGRIIS